MFFFDVVNTSYNLDHKEVFNVDSTDSLLALEIFAISYQKNLDMIDDDEFMNNDDARIFPMDELRKVIMFINKTLFMLYTRKAENSSTKIDEIMSDLKTDLNVLLKDIYS